MMSARPSSSMQARVLVAEDEIDMLELISRRVERLGHTVIRANDGREAMDALLRHPVDLVVTDINMPGYSGLEILNEAKQRDPNMQVIIVTANATMENAIEALNDGAFSYLTKPFDHISVISNAVSRAIEFRRLTLDNQRMAKAQKRRGDMLEDEVTDRFRQLQRQEKTYRELLAQLPQGIILASINGMNLPKNPAAERWLAEDSVAPDRPITHFLRDLVSANGGPLERSIELSGERLKLRASALQPAGGWRRARRAHRAAVDDEFKVGDGNRRPAGAGCGPPGAEPVAAAVWARGPVSGRRSARRHGRANPAA